MKPAPNSPEHRIAVAARDMALWSRVNRDRYVPGCAIWSYHDGRLNAFSWLSQSLLEGDFFGDVNERTQPAIES